MTAWRLSLAVIIIAIIGRVNLKDLWKHPKSLIGASLAGLCLGLHFYTWIFAVQTTTVANASLVFGTNPVFVAILERTIFKEKLGPFFYLSAALALAALFVLLQSGEGFFQLTEEDYLGISSGVLSSFLFAVYFICGRGVRTHFNTWEYTTVCYGFAALMSFGVLASIGLPLLSYSSTNFLTFALLALIPTILGHSLFNYSLRFLPASYISIATLAEPVLATVGAYFFWGEYIGVGHLLCFIMTVFSFVFLRCDVNHRKVSAMESKS